MARPPGDREPWIKVKVGLRRSDKIALLPNAAARLGWVWALLEGKTQRRMGVFASRRHLRELVGGAEGRHVDDFIKAGLAHEVPAKGKPWPENCTDQRCPIDYPDAIPGEVVIHDFRREQRDPTNADRQAEWRDRNANQNGSVTGSVTLTSRALSPSPSMSPSSDTVGDVSQVPATGDDAWRVVLAIEDLVGAFGYTRGSRPFDQMAADVTSFGPDRVIATYRELRAEFDGQPMDAAQLVFGGHKRLFPIPAGPRRGAAPKGMVQPVDEIREALRAQ